MGSVAAFVLCIIPGSRADKQRVLVFPLVGRECGQGRFLFDLGFHFPAKATNPGYGLDVP